MYATHPCSLNCTFTFCYIDKIIILVEVLHADEQADLQ